MEENKKDEEVKNTSEEASKVEKTEEVKEESKPEVKEEPKKEDVEKKAEEPKVEVKKDEKSKKKSKEKTNDPTKKKKPVKAIVFLILVVLVVIAVVVYFKVFHRKTIDLVDYLEISYYTSSSSSYYYDDSDNPAYNGYATISISFDNDKLEELLGTEKRAERFVEKTSLTVESDNNGSLSNGDVVQVSVDVSESYLKDVKLKLKDDTLSITVEGLEDADVLDLFGEDDFEVELTGISPSISMTVNNNSTDSFIKSNVTYSLSQSSGLSNGDVVTITANYDNSKALSEGLVIATNTYEYTVEGMPEYIDSLEDLSTEILDTLKAELVEEVKSQIEHEDIYVLTNNYDDVSYSDEYTSSEPELVSTYLLTRKGTISSWYSANRISAIYRVTYTVTSTGNTYDWYYVATAQNVAVQDGALYDEDSISYSVSSRYDDGLTQEEAYDDLIDSNKNNYVIETVE